MLGGPMVCIESWQPDAALDAMAAHDVRWTMLVPTMALQLSIRPTAHGRLSRLRAMTVGGGPMDAGALARAEQILGTKLIRVFGMSECLGHTTTRPDEDAETRLACDGRPFPGTVVRAVGEDGQPLPVGEVGAAQVRGPSMFVGYARHGRPQPPELTGDGFLPTGDLVRVNPEGTITVLGREKQIIIRGGRNIDVNEVEAAVARIPAVAQVCVVPLPDELLGERVAALVVSTGPALDPGRRHHCPGGRGLPEGQVAGVRLRRRRPAAEPGRETVATRRRPARQGATRNDLSSSHLVG